MSFYSITGVHCTYPIISAFLIIMFDPPKKTPQWNGNSRWRKRRPTTSCAVWRRSCEAPVASPTRWRTMVGLCAIPTQTSRHTTPWGGEPLNRHRDPMDSWGISNPLNHQKWWFHGSLMGVWWSRCQVTILSIFGMNIHQQQLFGCEKPRDSMGELTNPFLQVKLGDG